MYDAGKIIGGLIIFLFLITSPLWFDMASGKADFRPDPKIKTDAKACVMDTEYMRSSHMELLNNWRNEVVRENNRIHHSPDGKEYDKSLTNTCMSCHPNKKEFCDECHNYGAVDETDCFNCHLVPEEVY
ncbi:MAG: sulfate reduction electron transfer complex DsrMKJOP subunit DsrJ [Candidatus Zixiibacteriota bacterium]